MRIILVVELQRNIAILVEIIVAAVIVEFDTVNHSADAVNADSDVFILEGDVLRLIADDAVSFNSMSGKNFCGVDGGLLLLLLCRRSSLCVFLSNALRCVCQIFLGALTAVVVPVSKHHGNN